MSVQQPQTLGERVAGFFAWCGGAKTELIREFPEERTRLATIGATVLLTGLFAGASSSYAIHTVFGKGWWVPALAALWGAAIFNIDRLIVMTMHGDFVRKLIAAIPRLILATVIAVVITRPLELWIFAPEIKREVTLAEQKAYKKNDDALEAEVKAAQARYREAVATAVLAAGVITSKKALDEALAEVTKCRSALQTREDEYRLEMNGKGGSLRFGYGSVAKKLEARVQAADAECKGLASGTEAPRKTFDAALLRQEAAAKVHLETLNKDIAKAAKDHKQREDDLKKSPIDSLLGRNQQLSRLAATDSSVFWMNFFLMLLFWLIEALPVLAKLMAGNSIYDAVVEERREAVRATRRGAAGAADAHEQAGHAEAKAAALARQKMVELHYTGVNDVIEAGRKAWQTPQAAVDELLAAMEHTARQTTRGAMPKASELDGAPSSFERLRMSRRRQVFEIVIYTVFSIVLVFVFFLFTWLSPSQRATLNYFITAAGTIAALAVVFKSPFSRLFSRMSQAPLGEDK